MNLTKAQAYQLVLRAGAEHTKAQLYHYNWLRDYIEERFTNHYAFGENPVNYADEFCKGCSGDVAVKEAEVLQAFEDFKQTDEGQDWEEAESEFKDVMNIIQAAPRVKCPDPESAEAIKDLKVRIKIIGILVPVNRNCCIHCGG